MIEKSNTEIAIDGDENEPLLVQKKKTIKKIITILL